MKNYLRYAFIAVLAFICNVSFAQTVVTFTAETDKGSFDATQTGTGAGADKITKNGVTIQTSNGAFAATDYNTKAAQYRIYKSAKFTVSSTVGNITKVVITCTANGSTKNGPGCFTGDNYKASTGNEGTWSGNAASLTLTASSNQVRATKVEVTIGGETGGETPTPPAEETKAENIAAFKALASGTTATLTLKNAQVVYKNVYTTKKSGATNTEYYVRDASGAIQFFNTDLELNVNQVINGTVEVTYSLFNELPEAKKTANTSAEKLTITDGETAVPTKVTVADLTSDKYLCDLVTVENANIISETSGTHTNQYITNGTDKVMIYDKFKTKTSITDGEGFDVTGILVTAKLSDIIKELAPISAPVPTGINSITTDATDANAPAFNLAGQKVGKEYKGVVIKAGKKFIQK